MPKHGSMSAKAVGIRIKAKGLQKLRWYCQPCEKQCRDENGYKCHVMTEGHQRQLLLIAENPEKVIGMHSDTFKELFLKLLKRRFNTRRVLATSVYNEYIQDKDHLHMNATQWHTLTDFVKHLGREGEVKAEETEKGWYISWIDRDPEVLRRQRMVERREQMEKDEEERQADVMRQMMERDRSRLGLVDADGRVRASAAAAAAAAPAEPKRRNESDVVAFAMAPPKRSRETTTSADGNELLAKGTAEAAAAAFKAGGSARWEAARTKAAS